MTGALAAFTFGLGAPRRVEAASAFFDFLDPSGVFHDWFGGAGQSNRLDHGWGYLDKDQYFDDYDGEIGSHRSGSVFSDVFDTVDYVGGWFEHLDTHFFGRREVPRACADLQRIAGCWGSDYTHRQYERAVKRGRRFVLKRWSKHKNCRDLEGFVELINRKLKFKRRPRRRRALKMCQFGGFSDGALEALEGIREGCELSCAQDGRLVGKVSANIYCSLSQLTQGLETPRDFVRGPVKTCGKAFQDSCDESFVENAQEFVDDKGECRPFTEGEFEETFEQHRNNMCIFEIRPDEEGEESGSTGAGSSAPEDTGTGGDLDQSGDGGGSTGGHQGSSDGVSSVSESSTEDQGSIEPTGETTGGADETTGLASESAGGPTQESTSGESETGEDSSNQVEETNTDESDSNTQDAGEQETQDSQGAQSTGAAEDPGTSSDESGSESAGAQETGADESESAQETGADESESAQETGADETRTSGEQEGSESAQETGADETRTSGEEEGSESAQDTATDESVEETGSADDQGSATEPEGSGTQGDSETSSLSDAELEATGGQDTAGEESTTGAQDSAETSGESAGTEETDSGEQDTESDSSEEQETGSEGIGTETGSQPPTDEEPGDRVAAAPLLGAPGYFFLLLGAGGLATARRRKKNS